MKLMKYETDVLNFLCKNTELDDKQTSSVVSTLEWYSNACVLCPDLMFEMEYYSTKNEFPEKLIEVNGKTAKSLFESGSMTVLEAYKELVRDRAINYV